MSDGHDILGSETEQPQSNTISCESCKKKYKTNAGYERRVRNVHTLKSTIAQISDHVIADILKTVLSELGSDLCYPITIRSKWMAYQITQNEDLNVKEKEIYGKLVVPSNAGCFYEQFYSQLLTSPMYFPGLEYQLSVELLRKSADKILARFFRNSNSSPEYLVSSITSHEIDALEYLGGYVLHNIE